MLLKELGRASPQGSNLVCQRRLLYRQLSGRSLTRRWGDRPASNRALPGFTTRALPTTGTVAMRPCDGGPDRTGGKAGECAFAVEFSRSRRWGAMFGRERQEPPRCAGGRCGRLRGDLNRGLHGNAPARGVKVAGERPSDVTIGKRGHRDTKRAVRHEFEKRAAQRRTHGLRARCGGGLQSRLLASHAGMSDLRRAG